MNNPKEPYNDLPPLPPEIELETKSVLKRCITANKALAELNSLSRLLPDPTIIINSIPLQEAKTSSEIENIVTTQDELYEAAISPQNASTAAKEVLKYRTALKEGSEMIKKGEIKSAMLDDICRILRQEENVSRDTEPVLIMNRGQNKVVYTPPRGKACISEKMKQLESFINSNSELDPLIIMALAHYQFEAIHPYTDGNGRTGRILNLLILMQKKLLDTPILFFSKFILENRKEYYHRLKMVTEKDQWTGFIVFMLDGIAETSIATTKKINAITNLFEETLEQCRQKLPNHIYSKELIETIFRQPYCKIQFLVKSGMAKRQTASIYLQELEKAGILTSEQKGRENIYKNPKLIEVISKS